MQEQIIYYMELGFSENEAIKMAESDFMHMYNGTAS